VAADIAGIVAALAISAVLVGHGDAIPQIFWGLVLLPAWVLLFKVYGLYERDAKRVSHSTVDDLPWLFHSLVIGSLGLWLVLRYGPTQKMISSEGLVFFGLALGAIFLARAGARALSRVVIPAERVLFVGGGPMAQLLARKVRLHPEYELDPIGYIDLAESELSALPYLGRPEEIDAVCNAHGVERVVILSPEVRPEELVDLIRRLRGLDVRIGILPHVADVLGPSVEIDDVEGITVLGVGSAMLSRSSRLLKRAMDVTIALTLLVLTLPLMVFAALAIKLTSRGPILYGQERIGRGGRRFRMYKLRTMIEHADAKEAELAASSRHPVWLLLDDDPRVTRIGRLLRHTSIDELPQLWNVLRGDMSIVGPRPMPPHVDEHISGWGRRRLDLTPGITGLWQVLGRTHIPFEEMVKLDYLYVTNWSLWQDIRLIIRTLPAVLGRRGVN
jgi:exopolysaccharide biosynthesis polyprenyl glycosylphosphotransferase